MIRFLLAFSLSLATAAQVFSAVRLPKIFDDHMVLQRENEITVWGWADPQEPVSVSLAGQTASTVANGEGRWEVKLPSLTAGGPYELLVKGKNEIAVKDVLIGDVWLASGQSNMEWPLKDTDDAATEVPAANNPRMRMFKVGWKVADSEQEDVEGAWRLCVPDKAGWFSGVGYYFAKTLIADCDVPVAVINSSRGSSRIQPWIPWQEFKTQPALAVELDKWQEAVERFPEANKKYQERLAKWEADGKTGQKPYEPYGPGHYNQPGGLYNGMVAPLNKLQIRGIIWYQGEANATSADLYRSAFPILINSWRQAWNKPQLPFLFVQAASIATESLLPDGPERAQLREAQTLALSLPQTGMVVTLDIGGPAEHPRNKKDVGLRLARLAEKMVYGKDIEVSGPVFEKAEFSGGSAVVHLQHADGLKTRDGGAVLGFMLCGDDHVFHPAEAVIDGNSIVVKSAAVAAPVAVRYAWCNLPKVNLVNGLGLPLAPFRSDTY